jgi:hypothetical protein
MIVEGVWPSQRPTPGSLRSARSARRQPRWAAPARFRHSWSSAAGCSSQSPLAWPIFVILTDVVAPDRSPRHPGITPGGVICSDRHKQLDGVTALALLASCAGESEADRLVAGLTDRCGSVNCSSWRQVPVTFRTTRPISTSGAGPAWPSMTAWCSSPIAGDARGEEQRWTDGMSSEASSRAFSQ